MFQRLLNRFKGGERSPARVPEGMRVYTIGDIHGRADLLQNLHRMIRADASTTPSGTTKTAIYRGDYVDRGPHSRDVIDLLMDEPPEDFDKVYLKGNQDDVFLNFLGDESEGPEDMLWIRDEFLDSRADHGKVVVHGHSVSDRPQVRVNRIGIDTGALQHQLTCLVLEGATRRFLSTA